MGSGFLTAHTCSRVSLGRFFLTGLVKLWDLLPTCPPGASVCLPLRVRGNVRPRGRRQGDCKCYNCHQLSGCEALVSVCICGDPGEGEPAPVCLTGKMCFFLSEVFFAHVIGLFLFLFIAVFIYFLADLENL